MAAGEERVVSRSSSPNTPGSTAPNPPGVGTRVSMELARVMNIAIGMLRSRPRACPTKYRRAISDIQASNPQTDSKGTSRRLPSVPCWKFWKGDASQDGSNLWA